MSKNDLPTKKDVEEIVGRVVGDIVGDALQLIAERFDKQDKVLAEHSSILNEHSKLLNEHSKTLAQHTKKFDEIHEDLSDVQDTVDRVELIQRAEVKRADLHSKDIRKLKAKLAHI